MQTLKTMKRWWWFKTFSVVVYLFVPTSVLAGLHSTVNLAPTATVTASRELVGFEASKINDGDWSTAWIPSNNQTLATDWVNIELASPAVVTDLRYQLYYSNRVISDVDLVVKPYGSESYVTIDSWTTSDNAVHAISHENEYALTDLSLRFTNTDGTNSVLPISLAEVELYAMADGFTTIEIGGSMETGATEGEVNLALSGTAIAQDCLDDGNNVYGAGGLNDGSYGTLAWITETMDQTTWAGIILEEASDVDRIALRGAYTDRSPGTYILEYTTVDMSSVNPTDVDALEAISWTQIGSDLETDDSVLTRQLMQFDTIDDVTAVRVKIDPTSSSVSNLQTCLSEIEVYAATAEVPEPSTLILLGGLLAFAGIWRQRR